MKYFILILITLLPLCCMSQEKIDGTVVDDNGNALTGVIIQLRNSDTKKMICFSKTDAKGTFSIAYTENSFLEFSMLGFKKQRVDSLSTSKPLKIVMHDEAVSLNEVTVKADKVRQHGDTLNYHVGAYADKNDRSIGDVLAKIPGFEVDKQSGQVKYEGKPINKFYIEGLDMLGDKYGVATNSLPQVDVGTVQVMKNHQPIKVLENFTYTDEAAVNIKMKKGAKSHWVTSVNSGTGISYHTGLWKFEGLALRLKSNFQTMFTYKTNNTGNNINKETTSLFNFDEQDKLTDYISLEKPVTPSLAEKRTLFNRSHAFTANILKKFDESSQMNIQLIYNNNRESVNGERRSEFYLSGDNHIVNNYKYYLTKDNELYALIKYEKNSEKQYLKNSLSGDFTWSRQWLDESGTNTHNQYARKPVYEIKDNLYIIRSYGKKLISFYSNNNITCRPQSLYVDSLYQQVSNRQYQTNTYAMGGIKLGKFNLSLKLGVNAALNELESELMGLPDSIGLLKNDSHFGYAKLYAEPTLTYKTMDVNIELSPTTEYVYEKYSDASEHNKLMFSPNLSFKWYVTPRLRLSLSGSSSLESLDASRFYDGLIMQDFQYISQGYAGYLHSRSKLVRGGFYYNDALNSLHTILNVSRSFRKSPYTITRRFIGDYIILSAIELESKSDSWQATLMFSKGINLWNGVFNVRAQYLNSDAKMLQNNELTDYNNQTLNIRSGFDFSFYKDMRFRYGLTLGYSKMDIKKLSKNTDFHNWEHELSLIFPIKAIAIELTNEYYHNELTHNNYKDFFLSDIKLSYKMKHFDIDLSLNNIFNNDTYSYVINSDLISNSSTNRIRGREIMCSAYYKL